MKINLINSTAIPICQVLSEKILEEKEELKSSEKEKPQMTEERQLSNVRWLESFAFLFFSPCLQLTLFTRNMWYLVLKVLQFKN